MIPVLDFIAYVYYTAYKNTKFDEIGWREEKAKTALQLTFGFPGGFFISYMLAQYWSFYREICDEYFALGYVLAIVYLVIIARAIGNIYTEERLKKIEARHKSELPIGFARFLMFWAFLLFVGATVASLFGWIGAFAKMDAQSAHTTRTIHAQYMHNPCTENASFWHNTNEINA